MVRPPPFGRTVNFCTVFVRFGSRLNRKIHVTRLLLTVHVFWVLKTASELKIHPNIIFRTKVIFLGGVQFPPPPPLTPSAPRSLPTYWNPKYATGKEWCRRMGLQTTRPNGKSFAKMSRLNVSKVANLFVCITPFCLSILLINSKHLRTCKYSW